MKQFTQRRSSKYVTFMQDRISVESLTHSSGPSTLQEGDWTELGAYFNDNAPEDVCRKIKTIAAKRNWVSKAS